MGKIKRGILGGISGRVANVVGGSWKGLAYLRSLPLSVSQPNTARQVNARLSLTKIVEIAIFALSAVIKPLLDRAAIQMSGYNLFIQKNSALFPAGVFNNAQAAILEISEGKMDATAMTVATYTAGTGNLAIDWVNDSGQGFKLADDDAHVFVMDSAGKPLGASSFTSSRAGGTVDFDILPPTLAATINVYLAFRRFDGLVVGKTSYLQAVIA
jgi:hypothetical protein